MRAVLRRTWTLLVLGLSLALPARAVDREAPKLGTALANVILPTGPQVPTLNTTLPSLPSVETAAGVIQSPAELAAQPAAIAPQQAASPQTQDPIAAASAEKATALEQLSPQNAVNVGNEQASTLAAQLIDPSIKASGSTEALPVSASPSSGGDQLAPWEKAHAERARAVPESGYQPSPTRPTFSEWKHYSRLWVENIWFYAYTNIRNKWGPYLGYWRKLRDSGVPPIVSKPREFFATMRIFGQTGYFYVPGFGPLEDAEVIKEAKATFNKFFDGPGIGPKERAAFEGFVDRASLYNNKRRAASKFRATVRDNMLKASTMTPDKIAPFFDGLPIAAKTEDFQNNGTAEAILAQFKEVALQAVLEEPKDAKDRVTGVILIGSFALGAATPKSDFDIEPITADGGDGRVHSFADKVQKRWEALGRQKTNPVSFHYFGYLNSRWEIRAIHHEPYIIISPDQSVIDNLAMRPGEPPSHVPSRQKTLTGQFLRGLQYAAVYATSLFTPAKYPDKL